MGKLRVKIDDEIEMNFREAVKKNYGEGERNLERAFTEALHIWVEEKIAARTSKSGKSTV